MWRCIKLPLARSYRKLKTRDYMSLHSLLIHVSFLFLHQRTNFTFVKTNSFADHGFHMTDIRELVLEL